MVARLHDASRATSSRVVLPIPHRAMHRRAASMTRCSCVPRRSGPTNVIVRQIYPLCLAVNRSQCVMGHSTAPAVESAEDAGEQFGPHELGDLAGIGQVPPALVADE